MAPVPARFAVFCVAVTLGACTTPPPPQSAPEPPPARADTPHAAPEPSADGTSITLAYPKDVKLDNTVTMEAARASTPPPSLRFVVRPTTFVRFHHLIVTGALINDGDAEVEAIVFPAGPFVVVPGPNMKKKPPPPGTPVYSPPVPPPPLGIFVPAHATVTFEAALDLTKYEYSAGAHADLPWEFAFWNEPEPMGTLSVVLPPP
jgi:hypothetical protein